MSRESIHDELAALESCGYTTIKRVVGASELNQLQQVSQGMIDFASSFVVSNPEFLYSSDPGTQEYCLRNIVFPCKRSVEFQAIFGHPSILDIFERAIGPDFVIIHDQLTVKVPYSGVTFEWHRDVPPFHDRAAESLVVLGISLDYSTVANGCLHVVDGSHKLSTSQLEDLHSRGVDTARPVPIELAPGDVSLHMANCLHGSKDSSSGEQRRVVYLSALSVADYLGMYKATKPVVRALSKCLQRGIQLRNGLPYCDDEEVYSWKGERSLDAKLNREEYVEWGLPVAVGM